MPRATVPCLALSLVLAAQSALAEARQSTAEIEAPQAIRGKGYRLVQNWDFGESIKNEDDLREHFYTRYVYSSGSLDHLNDEWQRYRDNRNHVLGEGALSLVARVPGELKAGQIESGMLRSKWTGQYGYFEIRMRVPTGRGLWPAFWLNPEDQRWPPEIDIVEIVDNGRDTTRTSFHFLHGIGAKDARVNFTRLDKWGAYRPGFDYADGYHVFAVEWTQEGVRHYVDDVVVADRAFAWAHNDGSDGGRAHVLANLAVGGKWPGPPGTASEFPARLEIDYIRVWQR